MTIKSNIQIFLNKYGIKDSLIRYGFSSEELHKLCLDRELGVESDNGALAVNTGEFTGRSPKDRFIVKDDITKDKIYIHVVENYKQNGWEPITAFRSENDLMVFQRGEKHITIELSDARKIGQETKIIFTLSSKDKIKINQTNK